MKVRTTSDNIKLQLISIARISTLFVRFLFAVAHSWGGRSHITSSLVFLLLFLFSFSFIFFLFISVFGLVSTFQWSFSREHRVDSHRLFASAYNKRPKSESSPKAKTRRKSRIPMLNNESIQHFSSALFCVWMRDERDEMLNFVKEMLTKGQKVHAHKHVETERENERMKWNEEAKNSTWKCSRKRKWRRLFNEQMRWIWACMCAECISKCYSFGSFCFSFSFLVFFSLAFRSFAAHRSIAPFACSFVRSIFFQKSFFLFFVCPLPAHKSIAWNWSKYRKNDYLLSFLLRLLYTILRLVRTHFSFYSFVVY